MSISGKVALVRGAGQGIGRAIALRLANDGADIAVVDLNEQNMGTVTHEVRAGGRKATVFKADVSKRNDVGRVDAAGGRHFLPPRNFLSQEKLRRIRDG